MTGAALVCTLVGLTVAVGLHALTRRLVGRARLARIAAHGALWDEIAMRDRPTRVWRAERTAGRAVTQ